MKMSNETYNVLKWVTMIVLPAMGAAYFALSQIWPLPLGTEIVGTITILSTFLGSLLGISTKEYNKKSQE